MAGKMSVLEREVVGSLRRAGLASGGAGLVVAVSGGPDSTALLRCLHRVGPDFGLRLHVAHLNHDFRGAEADHDAAFVQRLADGLGLPSSIDKRDPVVYQRERGVSSFEQTAREMRYGFLGAVAQSVGAGAVVLGHTADDQAETVLLHLLRGAGSNGLRGMSELAEWPWAEPRLGPLLFRPLLGVTKADTVAYCRSLGQTYRQDSGNYIWRFTRNKVRHDLMPRLARDYNPRVREALNRLARAAAADGDYIAGELDRCWADVACERDGGVAFSVDGLRTLHPALQSHALRRGVSVVAGDARRLGERHIELMLSLLRGSRGERVVHLPRGVMARRRGGVLAIARAGGAAGALPRFDGEYSIALPQFPGEIVETVAEGWRVAVQVVDYDLAEGHLSSYAVRLNGNALGDGVVLRSRRAGDRFQPAGMMGTRKLQDFFVDAKVPRDERDTIPLLVTRRGIAWIAGHRTARWALPRCGDPVLEVVLTPPPV